MCKQFARGCWIFRIQGGGFDKGGGGIQGVRPLSELCLIHSTHL